MFDITVANRNVAATIDNLKQQVEEIYSHPEAALAKQMVLRELNSIRIKIPVAPITPQEHFPPVTHFLGKQIGVQEPVQADLIAVQQSEPASISQTKEGVKDVPRFYVPGSRVQPAMRMVNESEYRSVMQKHKEELAAEFGAFAEAGDDHFLSLLVEQMLDIEKDVAHSRAKDILAALKNMVLDETGDGNGEVYFSRTTKDRYADVYLALYDTRRRLNSGEPVQKIIDSWQMPAES